MRSIARPSIVIAAAAAIASAGCQGNGDKSGPTTAPDTPAPAPGAMNGTTQVQADDLHFLAPEDWVAETPASESRKIQYLLPGAGAGPGAANTPDLRSPEGPGTGPGAGPGPGPGAGAGADKNASLIIYYFGHGGAGTVQTNLDRWIGQFADDQGNPPTGAAIEQRTIAGLPVHQVVISGRYVAETSPGSGEHYDLPDQKMFAAVIQAPAGRYYLKAVGPRATMEKHWSALEAFLESMEVRETGATPSGPGHP